MKQAHLWLTVLRMKETEDLESFIESVESVLESLGVEQVDSFGSYCRVYQIPAEGGIWGLYGESAKLKGRKVDILREGTVEHAIHTSVEGDGILVYLGTRPDTNRRIVLGLREAGYVSNPRLKPL